MFAFSLKEGVQTCLYWFDGALEVGCILLMITTVAVTLTQVFFRYVLNASLSWPEELARWAFVWMVFLGMALAVHRNSHIAIDLLRRNLSDRWQSVHTIFVQVVICATSIALLRHGWDLARRASYVSPALEWHFRYLYAAVPSGAALNLFYLARQRLPGMKYPLNAIIALVGGLFLYLMIRQLSTTVLAGLDPSATLLICVVILLLLGAPVGFALAFSTVVAISPQGDLMMLTVSQNLTSALDSFILLAIPFFILSGGIMNITGITDRLIRLATSLVGHLRGGLGQVNIVTSVMMGGLTGSSMADAAATSKTLVPAMEQRGYHRNFSCAVTSASSVLANLIPPSLSLILYGALASASVGALFIATIVPGLLVAGALMSMVFIVSTRKGYGRDVERATTHERMAALYRASPALLLPIGIVGGVRLGIFTATEAGAMAFFYSLGIGFLFYRQINLNALVDSVRESFQDTIAVMFIVAAASPFAWVLVTEQVPQKIAAILGEMASEPALLLLLINVFLLIVGLIMELVAAMVILVPILIPIITLAGINPIHFGIVLVINLVMGALTPPMGMLIFTTSRIARASVAGVFYATLPFLLFIIVVLFLVTYIPALSLILPNWIGP
jgi:C4-dicarboxylate transporter DctM subunit